ncbi:hypothetical protein Sjap_016747 [Stephania japonica]|uniref:Uncharacterized protein n=1 Tax=Stephania japonica TaxID=461633 RepID=A0AAP0I4V1_9MAGN
MQRTMYEAMKGRVKIMVEKGQVNEEHITSKHDRDALKLTCLNKIQAGVFKMYFSEEY